MSTPSARSRQAPSCRRSCQCRSISWGLARSTRAPGFLRFVSYPPSHAFAPWCSRDSGRRAARNPVEDVFRVKPPSSDAEALRPQQPTPIRPPNGFFVAANEPRHLAGGQQPIGAGPPRVARHRLRADCRPERVPNPRADAVTALAVVKTALAVVGRQFLRRKLRARVVQSHPGKPPTGSTDLLLSDMTRVIVM